MLTILATTEYKPVVESAIQSIDRLDELVSVMEEPEESNEASTLVVSEGAIITPFDWYDSEPPYSMPSIDFDTDNLLALVFFKLGNHQKAFEFLQEGSLLYNHLLAATNLQFGYEQSDDLMSFVQDSSAHNYAIVNYYGNVQSQKDPQFLRELFKKALEDAPNDEARIFTLKHFINLLLDLNRKSEAKKLIEEHRDLAISDEAKMALDLHLAAILKEDLTLPYETEALNEIQNIQLRGVDFYEAKGLKTQAGLLLMNAAEVANFKEEFIRSKELINKAIQYFKEEDIPEFLGEAGLKKAVLLYTWSKNGSPQYYKAAINAFQDVLKVFKRDTHPQQFADVHHNLALIYSEIPVSEEEKPMWTAFCASSFKEVLSFYTKEYYPYEHAMASHNYATALMEFPPAKMHDNYQKARELFEVALAIRTADTYPFERALTLLNMLELGWLTHNEGKEAELKKYQEMKAQVEEIKTLISDPDLIQKAESHLPELEKLRTLIEEK